MSNPNGTQAVDRAARLLSEVVHAADPVTFTELADGHRARQVHDLAAAARP